jgi:hypothetical protein
VRDGWRVLRRNVLRKRSGARSVIGRENTAGFGQRYLEKRLEQVLERARVGCRGGELRPEYGSGEVWAPPNQAKDATGWATTKISAKTCADTAPIGRALKKKHFWSGQASNLRSSYAFCQTSENAPSSTHSGE